MSTSTQPQIVLKPSDIEELIKEARYLTDFEQAPDIARRAQYDSEVLVTLIDTARDLYGHYWCIYNDEEQKCLKKRFTQILAEIYMECGSSKFYNSVCRVPFIDEKKMKPLWEKKFRAESKLARGESICFLPFLRKRFFYFITRMFG